MIHSGTLNRQLEQLILATRPDVAHIHNLFPLMSPSILTVLQKHKIPIVMTLHNFRPLCLNGMFLLKTNQVCEKCKQGWFWQGIFHKCYRNSLLQSIGMAIPQTIHRKLGTYIRKVDLFIALNQFSRQKYIEAGFPGDKITVLPHFLPPRLEDLDNRQENYAVFIGRLSEEKGIHTLLTAFEKMPHLRLKILGKGPLEEHFKQLITAQNLQNIEVMGFIDGERKEEILRKAMFLVFSSQCYENMPYTILESFANGIPVVASRIGGLKELIHDGETGLLFEPGNVEDLIQKISSLIDNEALLARMRLKARQVAQERFSEALGYQNIIEAYQKTKEILARKG
jgi:glycosyltransferase involved in cell wall biosynthesis